MRGEAIGIGAKRLLQQQPTDLPVSGRAVLPLGGGQRDPGRGDRWRGAAHPRERPAAAQPKPLQVREGEAPDRARHVAKRIAAGVAVARGAGGLPDPQAVEHDDRGAPHAYTRGSRAPRPVRNSRCNSPLQAANCSSVIRWPAASPTSVATSPTATGVAPASTIVRSIVTNPTIGQRAPRRTTVASPLRPSEPRKPSP